MTAPYDPTDPRVEDAVLRLYGAAHNLSFADIGIILGLQHRQITGILRRHHFPARHNAQSDIANLRESLRRLLRSE